MKIYRSIAVAVVIFLSTATCSAEDLKFIDANGDIGYFVDLDTVKIESPTVFKVNMIVIRASLNQMEVADVTINHGEKFYIINSTKTLSYDERTELNSDSRHRTPHSYSDKSLMNEIVEIIILGGE